MRGRNTWSYRPFRPFLWEVGDIYICRIVPYENAIHFEWLTVEEGQAVSDQPYEVFYRKRGEEDFIPAGTVQADCDKEYGEYTIENLETEIDYEFMVQSGEKKSRIRLARTGKSVGSVVNYNHPDDEAHAYSGYAFGSPSWIRHPEGYLLASMDMFGPGATPQNTSFIFRSDDDGETWHYVNQIMPSFWAKLFLHKGEVYILTVSTEYGDLLIGKSTDGGRTFTAPTVLLRGFNGKRGSVGVHKNPQNILRANGRLYETLEWGSWGNKEYCHAAMVMSCDENDDLLVPENWSFTPPRKFDHFAPELEDLPMNTMTIEGTLVLSPEGKMYNMMRFGKRGYALAYEVNQEDPDAQLTYSHLMEFPANFSKFMIKYDEKSGKYYSVATRLYEGGRGNARNYMTLMASEDLKKWYDVCEIFDYRDQDVEKIGFQYVDFEFEGDDILFLCRTAINGAANFHDANYFTFHRIKNFREL